MVFPFVLRNEIIVYMKKFTLDKIRVLETKYLQIENENLLELY